MPPSPDQISILLVAETAVVRNDLRQAIAQQCPDADLRIAAAPPEIDHHLQSGEWQPEIVVLAAEYPQEWTTAELTSIWQRLPLARWIIVLEGWTASALRHVPQFPAACCVPRERFDMRLRRERQILGNRLAPVPMTAGLEEAFLQDARFDTDFDLTGLSVGLYTPDRDLRNWWRCLIEEHGGTCVSLEQNPHAVLWDLDPFVAERCSHLRIYHQRDPHCLILALRNIVNPETTRLALDCGAGALLPKRLGAESILERLQTMHANRFA